tara:strand:- start:64 stop:312 length:249 start_codon:yes stop_codon:yes gene_type:complete
MEEIMKFKFHETFTVDFVVEAETYEKAHAMYSKMFDKNIQLGYANWKDIKEQNITSGKFYVWYREDTETPELVKEEFFGEEE